VSATTTSNHGATTPRPGLRHAARSGLDVVLTDAVLEDRGVGRFLKPRDSPAIRGERLETPGVWGSSSRVWRLGSPSFSRLREIAASAIAPGRATGFCTG